MGVTRIKRISEEIRKVVSNIIMTGLKDPRVSKMTSVTHVDTTNDLRFTNIYISVYDPKADPKKTLEGLNSAKGFIRKEIGKELDLRYTPEPLFKLDKSIENGLHINSLLLNLGVRDEGAKSGALQDEDGEDVDDEDEDDDFDDEDEDDDEGEDEFDEDEDEDDFDEDENEDEDDDEDEETDGSFSKDIIGKVGR